MTLPISPGSADSTPRATKNEALAESCLAATVISHYAAVRRALEQARTTVTTDGPNPFADALTALDGAVFGVTEDATADTCSQCGAAITGYTDHYDGQTQRWRHVRLPDPVAEFLDAEHGAAPGQDGAQHALEPANPINQGDQA